MLFTKYRIFLGAIFRSMNISIRTVSPGETSNAKSVTDPNVIEEMPKTCELDAACIFCMLFSRA